MSVRLSLVIPAYNEADRIGVTLERACAYLAAQEYASEILVVDDGSRDNTGSVAQAVACGVPLRVATLPRNRGKGAAVREGLQQAQGDYRMYYDADGSTPIEELEKVWPRFDRGADIVIGSRALPESRIEVHQAWYRERMGRIYNAFLRALRLTRFHDTQCGFKILTAEACQIVLPRQTVQHFSFDAELLHIAQRHGLRIAEVPVRWLNSPKSKVNPLLDSTKMFFDLLAIRWRDWQGRYQ